MITIIGMMIIGIIFALLYFDIFNMSFLERNVIFQKMKSREIPAYYYSEIYNVSTTGLSDPAAGLFISFPSNIRELLPPPSRLLA